MTPQINFGYPWFLSYGHLVVLAVAFALWLFGRARHWSKIPMVLIAAVTLWSFAAFLITRFGLNVNGRLPLPSGKFLVSGSGRVLDMGAGTGRSTLMVLEARPQTTVVALDLFGESFKQHFGPGQTGQERLLSNLKAAGVEQRATIQTGGGVAIGVVQRGTRRIFVYGAVKEDSIFEIGSVSKTFTGLILAQMVAQHKVKLDEPVRELLPRGTVAKPDGAEITLLDLATQQSGLPRMPDNFHPADPQDPYADYRPANLYEFIAKHGVAKAAKTSFNYSNLGLGLLGQGLANRAAMTYPELLKAEITGPLELNDTVVKLSPEQQKRFAQGHTPQHQPAHAWYLDALAGAGAIRSTASDMLTYLEVQLHPDAAQLHPDRVKRAAGSVAADSPSATLASALQMSHELRADALPSMKVGLAWLFDTKTGNFWHNGGTGGYSSYVFFNPKEDYAAVVLFNTTLGPNGSFADRLGEHIAERLSGKPAISLKE